MSKRCVAVAELAVHLCRISTATGRAAFAYADVASALTSLERRAHRHAERLCNEPVSEELDERERRRILARATSLLARLALENTVRVEFNGDPRGAGLKLFHHMLPGNTWGGASAGYAVGC